MANVVEIRIVATGAAEAAKVMQGVADAGAQIGKVTATGSQEAAKGIAGITTSVPAASAALKDLQQRGSAADEALTAAGINTGILGRAIGALTNPVVLAGLAIGAITTAVWANTQAAMANAAEVKKLMAVSGLEAEAADNLADTFQLLGSDANVLTNALFKMSAQLESGGAGLRKIGLTYTNVTGAMNEGELFLMVRDKIGQMGTASERSAALMEIFGRAGRELAPIFALSTEKFKAFMDEASTLSPWSKDLQERTEALRVSQTKLGMVWDGLKISASELTTGPLTSMFEKLTQLITPLQTTEALLEKIIKAQPGNEVAKASLEKLRDAAAREKFQTNENEGTGGSVLAAPDARFAEQQAAQRVLIATGASAKIMGLLAHEEEARKFAVALGFQTEAEAARERVATVERELAAKKAVLDAELKAVTAKDDLLGTKALAVRQKIEQAEQEASLKRLQLQNDATLAQKKHDQQGIDRLAKFGDITDGVTTQLMEQFNALGRTGGEVGRAAREYTELGNATNLAADETAAYTAQSDVEFAALVKLSREVRTLEDANRDGALALRATARETELLATVRRTMNGRTLAELNAAERDHVEHLVDQQREGRRLAEVSVLIARGYTQEQAASHQAATTALADRQRQRIQDGDYFGFVTGQFALLAAQGPTTFEMITAATADFYGGSRAGLAEFFDFASDSFFSLEDLGKNVFASLSRAASDFVADALLAFGKGFFTGGNSGGVIGSLGAGLAASFGLGSAGLGGAAVDWFKGLGGSSESAALALAGNEAALGAGAEVVSTSGGTALDAILSLLPSFARGGIIPGGSGSNAFARMHGGELVIPADLTQRLLAAFGIGGGESGPGGTGNPGVGGSPPSGFGISTLGGLIGNALGVNSINIAGPLSVNPATVALSALGFALPGINMMSTMTSIVATALTALSTLAARFGLVGQATDGSMGLTAAGINAALGLAVNSGPNVGAAIAQGLGLTSGALGSINAAAAMGLGLNATSAQMSAAVAAMNATGLNMTGPRGGDDPDGPSGNTSDGTGPGNTGGVGDGPAWKTGVSRVPGGEHTPYGPVWLHGRERVLTAAQADAQDAGRGGGDAIHFHLTVIADKSDDAWIDDNVRKLFTALERHKATRRTRN